MTSLEPIIKCHTPVAILLAAYNGEKYISEQIESIIAQDCNEWTLYIRDDGSHDSTTEIIRRYSGCDSRVVLVEGVQTKGGLTENFFSLLRHIESDFYMFADQDDIWEPDKVRISLETARELERTNPGRMILIGSHNMVCDTRMNPIQPDFWYRHEGQEKMLNYNMAGVSCCMAGAEMIFNKRLRDEIINTAPNRLYYDHWILMYTLKHGGYVYIIPQILRLYRQHDSNVLGANVQSHNLLRKLKRLFLDYRLLKEVGYGSLFKYYLYRFRVFVFLKTARLH